MRSGSPQPILCPVWGVSLQYPSAFACTRFPPAATCQQTPIPLVCKPNQCLTTAAGLSQDAHCTAPHRGPVGSLPSTVTRQQLSNMLGMAAILFLWGNIRPKAGVAAGICESTVSSSSYYTVSNYLPG